MVRRQCTSNFKIGPIKRRVREVMAFAGVKHVVQMIGISCDEIRRMKPSGVRYITHEWPLVDLGWFRHDCIAYLREKGISAPRSACIGCPYRTRAQWRQLTPEEFADAVAFEREVQENGVGLTAVPYLHRDRIPLDEVDLRSPEERGQLTIGGIDDEDELGDFTEECEGMCGV